MSRRIASIMFALTLALGAASAGFAQHACCCGDKCKCESCTCDKDCKCPGKCGEACKRKQGK